MIKLKNIMQLTLLLFSFSAIGQEGTAASLFLKKDPGVPLDSISSAKGNLFNKLGHHGPAVENPWLGFRFYFDKRTSVDIYSKASPGLELGKAHWYPDKNEQVAGMGADYYKVGKSIGLGGVRLWSEEGLTPLHPVEQRTARVFEGRDSSWMELLSEGVEYQGMKVDILVRLTVYADRREARVEAFSLSGKEVRFATGINYFENLELHSEKGLISTWGLHPEDVAASPSKVGAAILYNEELFEKRVDDGKQILLVSRPRTQLTTWITSASDREEKINSFERFKSHLANLHNKKP